MQKLLIVDDDRWALHALTHDLADLPLHIEVLTNLPDALDRVARDTVDIVIIGCRAPGHEAVEALRQLQQRSPHTVRLLLASAADLQGIAPLIRDTNVFRLIRKPWTAGNLRSAVADAKSYRTLQVAASTAIEKVREMEATSAIRAVGSVEFGPDGTLLLEGSTRIEDLRNFDFGRIKSSSH